MSPNNSAGVGVGRFFGSDQAGRSQADYALTDAGQRPAGRASDAGRISDDKVGVSEATIDRRIGMVGGCSPIVRFLARGADTEEPPTRRTNGFAGNVAQSLRRRTVISAALTYLHAGGEALRE